MRKKTKKPIKPRKPKKNNQKNRTEPKPKNNRKKPCQTRKIKPKPSQTKKTEPKPRQTGLNQFLSYKTKPNRNRSVWTEPNRSVWTEPKPVGLNRTETGQFEPTGFGFFFKKYIWFGYFFLIKTELDRK